MRIHAPLFLSGEESERTLQELHLAVPAAHRPAQPFLLGQAALRGRDQQRHGREAHLQPRGGDGTWLLRSALPLPSPRTRLTTLEAGSRSCSVYGGPH